MARPFPKRIPLQSHIKQLRVEHYYNEEYNDGHWMIWLTANGDFTLGTFLKLCDNGLIQRITWHEDGTETILQLTED